MQRKSANLEKVKDLKMKIKEKQRNTKRKVLKLLKNDLRKTKE
jgi:hypothetical protein